MNRRFLLKTRSSLDGRADESERFAQNRSTLALLNFSGMPILQNPSSMTSKRQSGLFAMSSYDVLRELVSSSYYVQVDRPRVSS